jgi:hypothetical protein
MGELPKIFAVPGITSGDGIVFSGVKSRGVMDAVLAKMVVQTQHMMMTVIEQCLPIGMRPM